MSATSTVVADAPCTAGSAADAAAAAGAAAACSSVGESVSAFAAVLALRGTPSVNPRNGGAAAARAFTAGGAVSNSNRQQDEAAEQRTNTARAEDTPAQAADNSAERHMHASPHDTVDVTAPVAGSASAAVAHTHKARVPALRYKVQLECRERLLQMPDRRVIIAQLSASDYRDYCVSSIKKEKRNTHMPRAAALVAGCFNIKETAASAVVGTMLACGCAHATRAASSCSSAPARCCLSAAECSHHLQRRAHPAGVWQT